MKKEVLKICQLVGCAGDIDCVKTNIKMSTKQERRGDDSAGYSWINNGDIKVLKKCVTPTEFEKQMLDCIPNDKNLSIGHGRKPSVGKIKYRNSHPFVSCNGRFSLAHNGTTRGTDKLGNYMLKQGHKIKGDTDSEIIAHILCEYVDDNDSIYDSLITTDKILDNDIGNILVLDKSSNKIYGIRSTSLYVKKLDNATLIASTVDAFESFVDDEQDDIEVLEPKKKCVFSVDSDGDIYGKFEKKTKRIYDRTSVNVTTGTYRWNRSKRNNKNKYNNKGSKNKKSYLSDYSYVDNRNNNKNEEFNKVYSDYINGEIEDVVNKILSYFEDEKYSEENVETKTDYYTRVDKITEWKKDLMVELDPCPYIGCEEQCNVYHYGKCRYMTWNCPYGYVTREEDREHEECSIDDYVSLSKCDYLHYCVCPNDNKECPIKTEEPIEIEYVDNDNDNEDESKMSKKAQEALNGINKI